VPLELKRGQYVHKGLRPSQVRWHKDSHSLGIRTFGATITPDLVKVVELITTPDGLRDLPKGECKPEDFELNFLLSCLT
jgi:hypothetical protein